MEEQSILFDDLTKANNMLFSYISSMNSIEGMKTLKDFEDNNGSVWVRKIFERMEMEKNLDE